MRQIDKYTYLHLEEFKGVYSIVEGYDKDGEFKPSWCKREIGKEKTEKSWPVKVKIGDADQAKGVARWILSHFDGEF